MSQPSWILLNQHYNRLSAWHHCHYPELFCSFYLWSQCAEMHNSYLTNKDIHVMSCKNVISSGKHLNIICNSQWKNMCPSKDGVWHKTIKFQALRSTPPELLEFLPYEWHNFSTLERKSSVGQCQTCWYLFNAVYLIHF